MAEFRAVVIRNPGEPAPAWESAIGGAEVEVVPAAMSAETEDTLRTTDCVLLDGSAPDVVDRLRRVRRAAAQVQAAVVAPAGDHPRIERAILFSPGLGEVWVVLPETVNAALVARAAEVTRARRRSQAVQTRLHHALAALEPHRANRAVVSDAYLAGLLDAAPDPIISIDERGSVLSWNPGAERVLGRTRAEALGRPVQEVLVAVGGTSLPVWSTLPRTAFTLRGLRFSRPSGGAGFGDLIAVPVEASGHRVWALILHDLTETQRAQEELEGQAAELELQAEEVQTLNEELEGVNQRLQAALETAKASEEQFRTLANSIPQLAWMADASGSIFWYNQQWYDYTGTTFGEMQGWGWQSVHDPAELPRVVEHFRSAVSAGESWEDTFPLRSSTGEYRWFLSRALPIRDDTGRVIRWFGTNTDITEEKQTQEALHAYTEQLRGLTKAALAINSSRSLDAMLQVITDQARVVVGAHQAVTSMTVNDDWAQAINAVSLSDKYEAWREYQGMPDGSGIYSLVCRTNRSMRLTQSELQAHPAWEGFGNHASEHPPMRGWLAVPLVGRNGGNLGLVQLSDRYEGEFTEQDEAFLVQFAQMAAVAIENARLIHETQQANLAKTQFLANMSHELRTPLNAIGGYTDLMEMEIRGPITEEQRADLGRIKRAQQHLLGLINDVLNFAKLEAGRVEFDVADVPVDEALADAEVLITPQAQARNIAYERREGDPAIRVRGDREKIQQIVLNLLSNAIKFTDPGGRISVDWKVQNEHVRIHVRDTGHGIPPEKLASVFEPFVQVDPDLTRTSQGTGLGLAISRELARAMGGDLAAESTPGVGSTFTLVLPRAS